MTTRRELLVLTATVILGAGSDRLLRAAPPSAADDNAIEIWKSATCGCCKQWVEHMRANGFRPNAHDVTDVAPFKQKYRVPAALASCHTAVVSGYAIEGHVPADVVRQLLKERPKVFGLAVPGMPMGSPGMEGPYKDRYDVIAFAENGQTKVFARR
jgi:hypothetical protein